MNSTTKYIFAGVAAALAAGEACAQQASSQVVIYGIADACAARSDIGPTTSYRVSSGCQAGSRFGFRGTEQLGEGTAAYFTLENGFNIDDGSLGQGGRLFGRKAFVGLSSRSLGSIELGRDFAPAFYIVQPVDPMALGVGTASSTVWTGANSTTAARNDNMINYLSPAFGPLSVRVQFAKGEAPTSQASHGNDSLGANVIYSRGPLFVGAAYARQRNAMATASDRAGTLTLRYTMGAFTLAAMAQAGQWEGSRTAAAPASATALFSRNYRSWLLGGTMQAWAGGRVGLSLKRYDDRTTSNFDATQWTLNVIQSLSKRTELYAAVSSLDNAAGGAYGVVDATTTYSGVQPGARTSLLALGIKHTF